MAQVLPGMLLSGRRAHNSGTPESFRARKGSLEPRCTHDSREPLRASLRRETGELSPVLCRFDRPSST